MVADHRFDYLYNMRYYMGTAAYVIHYLANLPTRAFDKIHHQVVSRHELDLENKTLREKNLLLSSELQKTNALIDENNRLRELLLSARNRTDKKVVIAELVAKDSTPFKQRIILDKGARNNAYIGQPILGARGVIGQIISVTPISATGMLICDPSHAMLTQIGRSQISAVAVGIGNPHRLELRYLPLDSDVREGDTVITSGLGGRYPPDYPVGVVSEVVRSTDDTFATVYVAPYAELDRGKQVMLVWENAVSAAAEGQP